MIKMFAYVRVSTTKQGNGVSLEQQKSAIVQHAAANNMQITRWFEEKRTAAKAGRPAYSDLLKRLKKGETEGVIIHKIDRSARNLRDWADLGELIDQGVNIQFAHDNIDLTARGGRLSADLQAVIAADYIRNLRDETIKGLYGRLKQGLYPFTAPVGYLDTGKGKVKEIDPHNGPLVHEAFELYATGEYSLRRLTIHMSRRGLVNTKGNTLEKNGLSRMLHNPFYKGLIKIQRTGDTYPGIHVPLVNSDLFERVATILNEKVAKKSHAHGHLFSSLIRCKSCDRPLIGEKQKGHVYYRCHAYDCPTKSIREDRLLLQLRMICEHVAVSEDVITAVEEYIRTTHTKLAAQSAAKRKAVELELNSVNAKIERLTDLVLDDLIDKAEYTQKKEALNEKRVQLSEELSTDTTLTPERDDLRTSDLKNTANLWKDFENGTYSEKRQVISNITSNFFLEGKKLMVELKEPYEQLAKSLSVPACSPQRDDLRKLDVDCVICANSSYKKASFQDVISEIAHAVIDFPLPPSAAYLSSDPVGTHDLKVPHVPKSRQ